MNSRIVIGLISALACAGVGAQPQQAQPPRSYAVVSRIGDNLTVVRHEAEAGSHLDRNERASMPVADSSLDRVVLLAVDKALKQADAQTQVTLLDQPLPAEGAVYGPVLDGEQFAPDEAMVASLRKTGATHLILVSKYRGDAVLKARHNAVGTGKLEGLGFYLDFNQKMRRSDTGEIGQGFIAPYAYYRVSLVDLATLKVIKHHEVRASTTISVARNKDGFDPWESLSGPQKLNLLLRFIRTETPPAVADVTQL